MPNGTVKVIDYGISQGGGEERNDNMGTPMFMAPEQMNPHVNLDRRADIYALGCLLHYMATGMNPYYATSMQELQQKVLYGKTSTFSPLFDDSARNIFEISVSLVSKYSFTNSERLLLLKISF